jgi:dTDP-4-amino-4,6-dideoxygalactose transaminase
MKNDWLTMGEITKQFESTFSDMIQSRHAFAVSNGTAALHLALLALHIQPGDEILLPSLTFVACANVIKAVGATPVFVDIESETDWTISATDLEQKITKQTKAVMLVHYAGFPCNYDQIIPIAKKHNLFIVEDCAHALVSQFRDDYCGTLGDIGCFSFFSNKNMTTGEGGMVVTQNDEIADTLRVMRSHGMTTLTLDRYQGRAITYDVVAHGLNYRIDEIRSAIGRSQLKRLRTNLSKRFALFQAYRERLGPVDEIVFPFIEKANSEIGIHIQPIALRSQDRDTVIHKLKEEGIQASIHYPPIHRFQAYKDEQPSARCPLTEQISASELTLPLYPEMTEEQVDIVCRALLQSFS